MLSATRAARSEYDRLAAEYDRRWRRYIDSTMQAVLDVVRLEGSEQVLDVPCGTGELDGSLLTRWPDLTVIGVDLSPAMLQKAQEKDRDRKITWIAADVAHLPLSDHQFDYAICANSFHYFPFPLQSLGELRRVIRPGGTLVLVDWCDDYWTCKLCSMWLRWRKSAFQRAYSLRSCRTLLESAGFEVLHAGRFRVSWLWGLMRFVCQREV